VLLADVLRRALGLALLGIALGLAGALAMARGLQAILFETNAVDPLTYGIVALTIGAVAFLATLVPALRAARAQPAVVLRRTA
jgi:ABC-type antimicrobial peptide transport system permease subunit